jgi:RNA polymerase sigma-70 factor (ECF subfamily)
MELRATALWMTRIGGEGQAETDLAELVQRAVAGDRSAFEQIVVRFERRVLLLSWRLLGSHEDAEDAAQEVFLRAYKYLHRFDNKRAFEPWLVRLTVNVCRDLGRHRKPTVPLEPELLRAAGDPHSELSSEQRRQSLYRALAALPEKERAAVVLRDIEGLPTTEVAEILGSSEATVRSQISTARLKIKKAVQKMRGRK